MKYYQKEKMNLYNKNKIEDIHKKEEPLIMLLESIFTEEEIDLIAQAIQQTSLEELVRRGTLLYCKKVLNNQGYSIADLKVGGIVDEMMDCNESSKHWWEKREINAKSIIDWGKKFKNYKSINYEVIQRYLMLHREIIFEHHQKQGITHDHNRRVVNYQRTYKNNIKPSSLSKITITKWVKE